MARKTFPIEQIISKLPEAEVLLSQGEPPHGPPRVLSKIERYASAGIIAAVLFRVDGRG